MQRLLGAFSTTMLRLGYAAAALLAGDSRGLGKRTAKFA
jgi:hypothetical protein